MPDRDRKSTVQRCEPSLFRFADDGETPNHPRWPLVLYRSAVRFKEGLDRPKIFEELFAANRWRDFWRDGIYDFLHFHTHRHEVLGIAQGVAQAKFGGAKGRVLDLEAGDVVVLPAGTGHRRLSASHDLLVVGAYPEASGPYDEPKPQDVRHEHARASIAAVPAPKCDPVYGGSGPLVRLWG